MSRELRDLEVKGKGLISGGSRASGRLTKLPFGLQSGRRGKLAKYLKDRHYGGPVAAGTRGRRFEGYHEARQGKYR